jgi:hypothetical protein
MIRDLPPQSQQAVQRLADEVPTASSSASSTRSPRDYSPSRLKLRRSTPRPGLTVMAASVALIIPRR